MFEGFPKSKFEIVGPDGSVRGETNAIHTGNTIIVLDVKLVILPGDEMRRSLPSGIDETYEVVDPVFHEKTFGVQPHYQVKVRRKGAYPHGTGGHFNITVSGANARVNVGSTDNSTNMVGSAAVFGDLTAAIKDGISDETQRDILLSSVQAMKEEHGGGGFVGAYQRFISVAADHFGVVGPFLPALASLLSG